MQGGDDLAHRLTEDPGEGRRSRIDQGDGTIERPAGGRDLAADESGTDDEASLRAGGERPAEGGGIVSPAQGMHPGQTRFGRIRPGSGT